MAQQTTYEDTLRIHDFAIVKWLQGLLVDYDQTDHGVAKNQVPILIIQGSPAREYATIVDTLVTTGWITTTGKGATANAKDFSVFPLPMLTFERGEPQPDPELAGPAKMFEAGDYNPVTGQYIPHEWPGHYTTTYTVTAWCLNRNTEAVIKEWFLSFFGSYPGLAHNEWLLPVMHRQPWGLMNQRLRYEGSSDLSDLEGDDYRYLRTEYSFNLRTWMMFKSAPEAPQVQAIGFDVILPDPNAAPTDVPAVADAVGSYAYQTDNLFSIPYNTDMISVKWPVTGEATIAQVTRGNFPVGTLLMTVDAPTDTVPIIQRIIVPDFATSNDIVSISFTYVSDQPVTLLLGQTPTPILGVTLTKAFASGTITVTATTTAPHGLPNGSTVTVCGAQPRAYNGAFVITVTGANTFTYTFTSAADTKPVFGAVTVQGANTSSYAKPLPAAPIPKKVHLFVVCNAPTIFATIAGANVAANFWVSNIVIRQIHAGTQVPPTTVTAVGGETWYTWTGLPNSPLLILATLASGSASGYFDVDDDTSPTFTNSQAVDPAVNVGMAALIQPVAGTIVARTPTAVLLANVGAQVYLGGYSGNQV